MIRPPLYDTPQYVIDLLAQPNMESTLSSPRRDPGNPNLWWRVLPNDNSDHHAFPLGTLRRNEATALSPDQAVATALRHFDTLAKFGLPQPTIDNYLHQRHNPEQARLYSLAYHVEGLELSEYKEDSELVRALGSSLHRYVDWVELSYEPYMLWDITDPAQYMHGTTLHDKNPQTYLIDTDILLQAASPERLAKFRAEIQ